MDPSPVRTYSNFAVAAIVMGAVSIAGQLASVLKHRYALKSGAFAEYVKSERETTSDSPE